MRWISFSEDFDERAACQIAQRPYEEYEGEGCLCMSGGLCEIGNDRAHAGDDTSVKHERVGVSEEVDYFRDAHFVLSLISIFI